MSEPILQVRDLHVRFNTPDGIVHAVKGATFDIAKGEVVGVVGESGSGKSQMFMATIGLLASNGEATGSVRFKGQELIGAKQSDLLKIRGSGIGVIFQDPLTSLTPHMKIGQQIVEILTVHKKIGRQEAQRRALDMLELVRIPEARRRMGQYPHELSGGMRQRVMIAIATACGPDMLIADEPTTALDVTVQAQVLEIMRDLTRELGTSIALVSHDMGVIASMCDRVQVMRYGEFVEAGPVDEIFYAPHHDYTKMLLDAVPRLDQPDRPGHPRLPAVNLAGRETLLKVDDVKVHFPIRMGGGLFAKTKPLKAVNGVSFQLKKGETLGIVGESGCGKSTLARAVLQLVEPREGSVVWLGQKELMTTRGAEMRRMRKEMQIVFQDPLASLDPRMPIGASIAEPLKTQEPGLPAAEVRSRVKDMMLKVGLDPAWINRYPHEFSGGQNQRVGIARAMIVRPQLVVCDEAVSALDVSIQRQIVDLLMKLQAEFGMSLMFISHDLAVVRQISHRIMVLYLGRIVELADREAIYERPLHPYTRALISAVPLPDPKLERAKPRAKLQGDLPSPLDTRASLTFLKSKAINDPDAEQYVPMLIEAEPGHFVAEHDPV
ncbi:MAG: ABC transporter ATP-binding protein [Alphaproteobacteria bacterium]|nr:ABC transporter ATP-binding protein [Alphaproteobacteria bacterium]